MKLCNKFAAEFFGTAVLVLGGCGTAIFAGGSVGFLGVALAFGLTIVTATTPSHSSPLSRAQCSKNWFLTAVDTRGHTSLWTSRLTRSTSKGPSKII